MTREAEDRLGFTAELSRRGRGDAEIPRIRLLRGWMNRAIHNRPHTPKEAWPNPPALRRSAEVG